MSTDVRRVQFDFTSRDHGVGRQMTRLGEQAEGLHGKFGKLGASLGGMAGYAKGGAAGLALMGGAAISFGVKTAASMEQAEVSFKTMLGSATKAKAFMGELSRFASNTPFEMKDLTSSAQKLLAFGFQAKQVIPTMTAIGDASGGSAEKVQQITLALGQMMAKGKVQGDELLQITEAGIPGIKILANEFHVTTGKMQDMISKGLVPANKAIPGLLAGIEKGTSGAAGKTARFGGMMAEQSKTLIGVWSNLKDTAAIAAANMVKPFMPLLKGGLSALVPLTAKIGKGFEGLGGQAGGLRKRLAPVGDWIRTKGVPALREFGTWFEKKIMPVIIKFDREVLKELLAQFRRVGKELSSNDVNWKATAKFIGKVAEVTAKVLGPVMTWFYKIVLKTLGTAIVLAIKQIKLIAWFIDDAAKRFKTGGKAVVDFGKTSREAFGKMKDVAVSVFLSITRTFVGWVRTLVSGAARAFGWVPGLGPKLRKAEGWVADWARKTEASVQGMKSDKTITVRVKAIAGGVVDAGSAAARRAIGFAKGGPVPKLWSGATEAYDSQPALLRVNEHVWTPEEVKAVGGHDKMMRLRQAARQGLLQGFERGGPVGVNVRASVPSSREMSGVWGKLEAGIGAILVKFATKLASIFGGATGVVRAARSMIGYPYSWGGGGKGGPSYGIGRGAGTYGFDCSGLAEYAWWKGAHKSIGGVTGEQWANSRPISGPRPGALAFPHGPAVHVMIGSDRPGYVIQAPFTGSFVQEVPRSSGNWRWPIGAYAGGPVGQFGARALRGTRGLGILARALGIAGRADGGLVRAKTPYLVGENGPELLVPDSAAYVSPFKRSSAPFEGLERSSTPYGFLEKGRIGFPAPRRKGSSGGGSGGGGGDTFPDITTVTKIGTVNHVAMIANVANVANVARMAAPNRRAGAPLLTPDHVPGPLERAAAPYRRALDRASGPLELHVHLHPSGQLVNTKEELGRYLISAVDRALAGGASSKKLVTK